MALFPRRSRIGAGQAGNLSGLDSAEFDLLLLDSFPAINAYDSKSCTVWVIGDPLDLTRHSLWSAAPGQHLLLTTSFKISSSSPESQEALRELLTSRVCTLEFSLVEHGEAISRILLDLPESSALRHLRVHLDFPLVPIISRIPLDLSEPLAFRHLPLLSMRLQGLLVRRDAATSLIAALKGSPWKVRGLVFERSPAGLRDYLEAQLDYLEAQLEKELDRLEKYRLEKYGLEKDAVSSLLQQLAEAMLELHSLQCVGFLWFDEYFFANASLFAQFFKTLGEVLTSPCLNIRALSFYHSRLQPSILEALLSNPHKLTRLDLRSTSSSVIFGASRPDHLQLSSIRDLAIGMDSEIVQAFGRSSILHVSANLKALRLSLPSGYTECSTALTVLRQSEVLLEMPQLQILEFDLGYDDTPEFSVGYVGPPKTRGIFAKLSSLCRSVLLDRPTNGIHSLIIRGGEVGLVERGPLAAEIVGVAADQARLQMSRPPSDELQSAPSSFLVNLQFLCCDTLEQSHQRDEMALANALRETMICSFSYPWKSQRAGAMAASNLKKNGLQLGLLKQPMVPPTTAKLFICGFGEVGKTTIRNMLTASPAKSLAFKIPAVRRAILIEPEARTKGIEFHTLTFSNKKQKDNPRKLVLCDLAGQEEYHVFHHYFLSGSNLDLFMVVCKYAPGMTQIKDVESQLDYWFRFILSHKSSDPTVADRKPRVLVVLNDFSKRDMVTYSVQDLAKTKTKALLDKYSEELDFGQQAGGERDVFGIHAIHDSYRKAFKQKLWNLLGKLLESRPAIPKICHEISDTILPGIVKSLHKMPMLISHQDLFQKYCLRNDLNRPELAQKGMFGTFEAALNVLHNAGEIVYFPTVNNAATSSFSRQEPTEQELKERAHQLVIINPTWFCSKVVGQLLTPKGFSTYGRPNLNPSGCDEEDLKQMLRDQGCEEQFLDQILEHLQRLELCFQIPEDKITHDRTSGVSAGRRKKFIFPSLLDAKHIMWPPVSDQPAVTFYGRRLRCRDEDKRMIPAAIFTRLQVRLQGYICGHTDWYKVGNFWASFVKHGPSDGGTVGGVVSFGGGGLHQDRWEPNQWIDIFLFYSDASSDTLVCEVMEEIKDTIFDICQGIGSGLVGIPTVQLEELVLSGKPSETQDQPHAIPLDTVNETLLERGIGSSFCWPSTPETKRVLDVLLPSELKKHIEERLEVVDEIRKEFDADSGIKEWPQDVELDQPVVDDAMNSYAHGDDTTSGHEYRDMIALTKAYFTWMDRRIEKRFARQEAKFEARFDGLSDMLKEIRKDVNKLAESLQVAQRDIISRCSTHLVMQLLKGSLPLYPYLMTEDEHRSQIKEGGAIFKVVLWELKRLVNPGARAQLHLLCEWPRDSGPHMVKGQEGIEIIWKRPEWLQKVAPVLVPALRVLCCVGRIAASVYLPSTQHLIPDPDGFFKSLGIDRKDLTQKVLPKALEGLIDGVEGLIPKQDLLISNKPLELDNVRSLMLELLRDKEDAVDMGRDFGLQHVEFRFQQGAAPPSILWVCEEHARRGQRLPSRSNPWKPFN